MLDPPYVTLTKGSYLNCPLGITLTGALKTISACGTDLYLIQNKYIWVQHPCTRTCRTQLEKVAQHGGLPWAGHWEGGQGTQEIKASNGCWVMGWALSAGDLLAFRIGNLGYLCSLCLLQAVSQVFQGRNGWNAAQTESSLEQRDFSISERETGMKEAKKPTLSRKCVSVEPNYTPIESNNKNSYWF